MTTNRPKVYVIECNKRGFLLRAKGFPQKQLNCRTRRAAERAARDYEEELIKASQRKRALTWHTFAVRYEDEHVDATSRGNQTKWNRVRAMFSAYLLERGYDDIGIDEITVDLIAGFRGHLKNSLPSIASVGSYFATFRAGLSYAAELGLMPPLPSLRRRGKQGEQPITMKGRPVTPAEFQRMLDAVPLVVGGARALEFELVLKMIWFGGLRVYEPLLFHATNREYHHIIDLEQPRPAVIFTGIQKNRKYQRIPMLPEWSDFCRSLPRRPEWVFNPINERGWRITTGNELGRVIGKIGERAKIITVPASDNREPKYATAQNLRQGFGARYARRMLPTDLQMRMRHASIATTMKFYAGLDMQEVERVAIGGSL